MILDNLALALLHLFFCRRRHWGRWGAQLLDRLIKLRLAQGNLAVISLVDILC